MNTDPADTVSVRIEDLILLTGYFYGQGRRRGTPREYEAADRCSITLYGVPDLHEYGRRVLGEPETIDKGDS